MEINTVVLNSWPGSITDFNRKNVSAKFSGGYSVGITEDLNSRSLSFAYLIVTVSCDCEIVGFT
jgi:hypothetical protein